SSSYPYASPAYHHLLLSFPTRRSADLAPVVGRHAQARGDGADADPRPRHHPDGRAVFGARRADPPADGKRVARSVGRALGQRQRSEEHTSELQSRENLVCRLLLEKKKN